MDQQEVYNKYKIIRRNQFIAISIGPLVLAVALAVMFLYKSVLLLTPPSGDIFLAVVVVTMLGGFVYSFFNWKCPACCAYLGRNYRLRFCPKCGVKLVENK